MKKMWAGRTDSATSKIADDFNSSIGVDQRMYREDIRGSIAHAQMLMRCGIISEVDASAIQKALEEIKRDITSGALTIDMSAEDIHMFIEEELTSRIGDAGKRLHTARSRNDQVALDIRLYLRGRCDLIRSGLCELLRVICDLAETYKSTIMPGYTHLQRAQPITFGHYLMAYAQMFRRDIGRIDDLQKRIAVSPIGSCALAGTTYPTDRQYEAGLLGMSDVCENSLDGVSDRDFCVEFISMCSILMMHLSRFSEELILYSSWEFHFIELDDAFTTGSSIMPQKKNSDMAELTRGKTGRVYGDLITMLTILKGLPLAYNKDMQEDKEAVFDACDTVLSCLEVFTPMIQTMHVHEDSMLEAAQKGFINATDLADYLTEKGVPFRTAYKISGQLVAYCIEHGTVLERLPLDVYRKYSDVFEEDLYKAIDLQECAQKRSSYGGTSVESVQRQIESVREFVRA